MAAPVKLIAILSFGMGCAVGFGAGVLAVKEGREFVTELFRTEQTATVQNPTNVDRPSFRFQHSGNWKVDTADEDYDPDHSFSVESPGQSLVMFQVADAELVPKEVVETHAALQESKVIKQSTRSPFTQWGKHTGEGVLLEGKLLGLTPGSIRIFVFRAGPRTYTVIEQTFDDDRRAVAPGFLLIEQTFEVKE